MNYQANAQAAVMIIEKTTYEAWSDTQSAKTNYTTCFPEKATPKYPYYIPAVKLGAYLAVYAAPAVKRPPNPNPANI